MNLRHRRARFFCCLSAPRFLLSGYARHRRRPAGRAFEIAVDDALVEGPHPAVITHTAASADPGYAGAPVASVTVHITDNDPVVYVVYLPLIGR